MATPVPLKALYFLLTLAAIAFLSADSFSLPSKDRGDSTLPSISEPRRDPLDSIRSPRWMNTPSGKPRAVQPLRA
jgi:hypothetical protein